MGPFPSYLSRSVPVYVFGFNEMEKKGVGLDVITFDMNKIVQLTLDDVLDKNWERHRVVSFLGNALSLVGWCRNEEAREAKEARDKEIHAAWLKEQEELAKKTEVIQANAQAMAVHSLVLQKAMVAYIGLLSISDK